MASWLEVAFSFSAVSPFPKSIAKPVEEGSIELVPEINYLTLRISFSLPINPKPMSRTSGHILTTKITNNTERTVVRTRTLEEVKKFLMKTATQNGKLWWTWKISGKIFSPCFKERHKDSSRCRCQQKHNLKNR